VVMNAANATLGGFTDACLPQIREVAKLPMGQGNPRIMLPGIDPCPNYNEGSGKMVIYVGH